MKRMCLNGFVLFVSILIINIFLINNAYTNSLSIEIIDVSTGAPSSSGFSFSDSAMATQTSPWVVADQYFHIEFDCDYSGDGDDYWGLRIVTDNMVDVVADADGDGVPDDVDGDGVPDDQPVPVYDESGNASYGGLIKVTLDVAGNIASVTDGAAQKINLAWQIYNTVPSLLTAPAVSDIDGDGIYTDNNVSTDWWTGDWAYIGDKSDDGITEAVLWQDEANNWVLNYNVIAYGLSYFIRNLTPHPDDGNTGISDDDLIDEDGDGDVYDDGWDIYLFMAGRFWNTDYGTDSNGNPVAEYFQLPVGDYQGNIYIELFWE